MEHARVNLMTADPARIEDVVRYVKDEARPVLEDEVGNLGLMLLVNAELAVVVVQSFWVSGDAMRDSERTAEPLRKEAVRRGVATVSVERHEVASSTRITRPPPGAGVRMTRVDVDPAKVPFAIAAFEDTAVPWLTETDGFCQALALVHRRSGRGIVETVWRDAAALAASRSAAAAIRADAIAATDSVIRALEEFRLEYTSVRD